MTARVNNIPKRTYLHLGITQGEHLEFEVDVSLNGVAIEFTSYTLKGALVEKNNPTVIPLVLTKATDNLSFTVSLDAEDTAKLTPQVYGFEVFIDAGKPLQVLDGSLEVKSSIY